MSDPANASTNRNPAAGGLPQPELAAQALTQVLRPLARLMIDHGLQLPALVDLMKSALVAEADRRYGLAGKGNSDTRIALLTGVHRKDVKRLRGDGAAAPTAVPDAPLAAAVVARWISEPRYLNANRTPRALARTALKSQAGAPDFTTLVSEVTVDVGARAVLDELLRLGVVTVREDGMVALTDTAFVPARGGTEAFQFLAANVSDHLATAVHNLSPHGPADIRLEQSAFSEPLTSDEAEALHALARQLWAGALQSFLQMATVAEQRSAAAASGPRRRVRLGVYFADEAVDAPEAAATPAQRSATAKPAKKTVNTPAATRTAAAPAAAAPKSITPASRRKFAP